MKDSPGLLLTAAVWCCGVGAVPQAAINAMYRQCLIFMASMVAPMLAFIGTFSNLFVYMVQIGVVSPWMCLFCEGGDGFFFFCGEPFSPQFYLFMTPVDGLSTTAMSLSILGTKGFLVSRFPATTAFPILQVP